MANTSLSNKPGLTYCISYGFLGGNAHSRQFRKLLQQQGLHPVKSGYEPDILIAHSAGCWLIPQASSARLVVFIGMPLAQENPGRTFRQANRQNIRAFFKDLRIIKGMSIACFSLYYAVTQPKRNRAIMRQVHSAHPVTVSRAAHVFIANQHDPWPQSKQLTEILKTEDWAFIGLPGSHDDIWEHPGRYAAIINHYARLLA